MKLVKLLYRLVRSCKIYIFSKIDTMKLKKTVTRSCARLFCIGDEPKSGFARDLGDCLQSQNMPFGTSGDPACFIDSPLIDHPQQSQLFLSLRLSKIVSVLFR